LLTLALVYKHLTGDVPTVSKGRPAKSKGEPTAFERFASERFDAIGKRMPFFPPAEFGWYLKRATKDRFNKDAVRRYLWGDIPAFSDAFRRNRAIRKARSAIVPPFQPQYFAFSQALLQRIPLNGQHAAYLFAGMGPSSPSASMCALTYEAEIIEAKRRALRPNDYRFPV
jgi:hypothetical protein